MTFQIGERVRFLANDSGIPEGAKGHVASEAYEGLVKVDIKRDGVNATELVDVTEIEKVGLAEAADEVARVIYAAVEVQAGHDDVMRAKLLMGTPFAQTNTPEEMLEIKFHMRQLIDSGYTFFFIERYLKGMNYPTNLIRHVFKKITGLTPQEAVNINAIYTPGTIPQFNLGWGEAKKGKNEYYFVMPIKHGYSVFCQEGDIKREEVSHFPLLTEALEHTKKLVKKLEQWNPPVKDVKSDVDATQLYQQVHIFREASTDRLYQKLLPYPKDERLGMVRQAYIMGMVGEQDRDTLLSAFGAGEEAPSEVAENNAVRESQKEKVAELRENPDADSTNAVEQLVSEFKKKSEIEQDADQFIIELQADLEGYTISDVKMKVDVAGPRDVPKSAVKSPVDADGFVVCDFQIAKDGEATPLHGRFTWPIHGKQIERSTQFVSDDRGGKLFVMTPEDIGQLFEAESEADHAR